MKKPYNKPGFVKTLNGDKPHTYCVINKVNGNLYVGVHNGKHTSTYMGSGKLIQAAHAKYGMENFKKVILKEFDTVEEAYEHEELIVNEAFIIRKDTYNIQTGGTGFRPETQAKARKVANEYHKSTGWARQKSNGYSVQPKLRNLEKCAFHNKELQRKSAEKAWAALKADGYSKSEAKKQATCPHCDKTGNAMAMKRWHFDRCKFK